MRPATKDDARVMRLRRGRVTVRNPAATDRCWEGDFVLDPGAIDSVIPRERLEEIGLKPAARRICGLADGREDEMDIAVAELEFMGDVIGATIVFGGEGTEPLLGVTALESLGIEVDPTNQQFKRLPSIRLKKVSRDAAITGHRDGLDCPTQAQGPESQ